MTEIIDLGNGYGKVIGYKSPYANLHIELKPTEIRRLYSLGYLSRDEYYHWLLYLGYSSEQVDFLYALDSSATVKFFRQEAERLKRKGVNRD